MEIKFDGAVLIVNNLDTMRHFYETTLSQKIKFNFGSCIGFESGFSLWKLNDAFPISSALKSNYNKLGNTNFEMCFVSESFNEVALTLKDAGVELLHDVVDELWGQKTIRFYDPEHNLIEVGESLRAFALRIFDICQNIDQVSTTTGIPKELINQFINNRK